MQIRIPQFEVLFAGYISGSSNFIFLFYSKDIYPLALLDYTISRDILKTQTGFYSALNIQSCFLHGVRPATFFFFFTL